MKKPLAVALAFLIAVSAFIVTASAADGGSAVVSVDGVAYSAHVGDTITYTYYLDMTGINKGKATQIQGELLYDADRISVLSEVEPVTDSSGSSCYDILPNLSGSEVVASKETRGKVGYNTSKLRGYTFTPSKILVAVRFKVIAAGASYITHTLLTLAAGDGLVLVKRGEPVSGSPEFGHSVEIEIDCPHTSPVPGYEKGDVDMDGKVTILDATCIQLNLAGKKALTPEQYELFDFNGDGLRSILDATAIQRRLAHID